MGPDGHTQLKLSWLESQKANLRSMVKVFMTMFKFFKKRKKLYSKEMCNVSRMGSGIIHLWFVFCILPKHLNCKDILSTMKREV